jgi:hypothetical protein
LRALKVLVKCVDAYISDVVSWDNGDESFLNIICEKPVDKAEIAESECIPACAVEALIELRGHFSAVFRTEEVPWKAPRMEV